MIEERISEQLRSAIADLERQVAQLDDIRRRKQGKIQGYRKRSRRLLALAKTPGRQNQTP